MTGEVAIYNQNEILRVRGGGGSSALQQSSAPTPAPSSASKIRLTSLDGVRFFLIMHIVLGHFVRFADPSEFIMKFFAQINVTVGAFFALAGYFAAYTSTNVGERTASPKLTETPSQKWCISKNMGYYPLHWIVLLIFSPMFVYVDVNYSGWLTAVWHGILSITLTQSWFPMHAEVWNAPTWFLSSLTFANAVLPFALPKIATMDTRSLKKTAGWLFLINLLPKLGYAYDHGAWQVVEGMTAPKLHKAFAVFNGQRFLPIFNLAEVIMGAVACRIVMLDDTDSKDKPALQTTKLSSMAPLLGLVAVLAARALPESLGIPPVSDLLVRAVLFTPLFLRFLMGTHRNAVRGIKDPISSFLSSKLLVWLGGLSFPIYIVHGPIGQVFYKRLIAGKLWGGVLKGRGWFGVFMGVTMLSAYFLQTFFMQNSSVKKWSRNRVDQFSSWM